MGTKYFPKFLQSGVQVAWGRIRARGRVGGMIRLRGRGRVRGIVRSKGFG